MVDKGVFGDMKMRIQRQNGIVRLWLSARDTRDWVILMAGMRVIEADQRNQQNSLVEAIR